MVMLPVDIEVKNGLCNSDREQKSHARDINFSIVNGAHRDGLNVVFSASPEAEIFVYGQTCTNRFSLNIYTLQLFWRCNIHASEDIASQNIEI